MSAAVAAVAAGAALSTSLGGPLAAVAGWLPGLVAFRLFSLGSFVAAVLALGFGLGSLLRSWSDPGASLRGLAWFGTLVGAAILLLLAMGGARASRVPAIHDLTTDPADPPSFTAALRAPANGGRDLTYPHGPADTAAQQRKAYPQLAPRRLAQPPQAAFETCLQAATGLGWQLTWQDAAQGLFEATDTTAVFRFIDDVVVRVRPGPDGGSVVDVRSTSRVGLSDLGTNAERIERFFAALDEAAAITR